MTFIAKTQQPVWLNTFNSIATLADEATFEADKDGLRLRIMDPSHIALIDINMPPSDFELYQCDELVKFGVRVDDVLKMIRRGDKKDALALGVDTTNSLLTLDFPKTKYKSMLIESSASSTTLPKLNLNASIDIATAALDKVLGDIQVVSDYIIIEVKNGQLSFSGRGDNGESDVSGLDLKVEAKEDSKSIYSIDYLTKIVKAVMSTVENAKLEFSSKMPLRLTLGRITYFLAPRVQD